jgi:hypothetical protein
MIPGSPSDASDGKVDVSPEALHFGPWQTGSGITDTIRIKNLSALSFTMTSLTLEGDGFLLSPSPLTGAKLYGRRLRVVGCLEHATDDNRQGRYVTNLPNTYSDIFLVQSLPRLDAPTPLIADGIMCGEWNRLASWSAAACMPAVTTVESRDLLQIEG